MNKLKTTILAACAIAAMSTNAFAGQFGIGVSGSIAAVAASGTEKDTDNTGTEVSNREATASNNVALGSIFAEYTFEGLAGMTFGVDMIPATADVNSKNLSRTDTAIGLGTSGSSTGSTKYTAQAEISDHYTYYAELPLGGSGVYVMAGYTEMDVATKEKSDNAQTGSYPDTSVDGVKYGIGVKGSLGSGSMFYKIQGSHTEYDTLTVKSDSTKPNSISADLDVTAATIAVGFNF